MAKFINGINFPDGKGRDFEQKAKRLVNLIVPNSVQEIYLHSLTMKRKSPGHWKYYLDLKVDDKDFQFTYLETDMTNIDAMNDDDENKESIAIRKRILTLLSMDDFGELLYEFIMEHQEKEIEYEED